MKKQIRELKEELKILAAKIRADKGDFRKINSVNDKKHGHCNYWEEKCVSQSYKEIQALYKVKVAEYRLALTKLFGDCIDEWTLFQVSQEYRHSHIAYCELRGRTRDQIEKPREGNEPNESHIEAIKKRIREKANETALCAVS